MIRLILITVVAATMARSLSADVVVMDDGRILRGEIVRETAYRVVLRMQVDGTWTDVTLERRDIDELFEELGNQADTRPAATKPAPAASQSPPAKPAPVARPADDSTPLIAVIPLRGQVGGLLDGSVSGTFDAEMLALCLDRAEADGADAVVLDIRSPGGYLVEMEDIGRLIVDRGDALRIVAYPREALSAAAIIALTCPEMIVRRGAQVGAAVMIQPNVDGGVDAVDAKRASPHHARQREFMAASGRPYPLLAAMTIQEAQLWWSASAGLIGDADAAAAAGDARLVDGVTTVLTMTASDALAWKVAGGRAETHGELAATLGLDPGTRVVVYDETVERHLADVNRRLAIVLEQFGAYFRSLGKLEAALGGLEAARVASDREQERRLETELRRLVGRARTASRAIQGQDHRLLARRTDLPEGMMERLDKDGEILAEVGRLSRDGDPAALHAGRGAVQQILERWRALLTF